MTISDTPTLDKASIDEMAMQCRKAFSLARLADRMDCPAMARGYRATGRMLCHALKVNRYETRLARMGQVI